MKIKEKGLEKIMKVLLICTLICGMIFLFFIAFSVGTAIIESHNICNAMNLTGC